MKKLLLTLGTLASVAAPVAAVVACGSGTTAQTFAEKQIALKAKIDASKLDVSDRKTLDDLVVGAKDAKALKTIEANFITQVTELTTFAKSKTDGEAAVNALTNLNTYSKKIYITRVHNALNALALKTILTSAKFEDGKGSQIKSEDYATQANALVLDNKVGSDILDRTKGISSDIYVSIKNSDIKLANDHDGNGNYYTEAFATTTSSLKIVKEDFNAFKAAFDDVFAGYEAKASAATKVLSGFDLKIAIADAGVTKALSDKFGWSSGALTTDQSNKDAKAAFEAEEKTPKTQADIDDLLARIKAFKPVMKPATPAVGASGVIDWTAKAQAAFDAADKSGDYYGFKLAPLRGAAFGVTDEASYNKLIADLATAHHKNS